MDIFERLQEDIDGFEQKRDSATLEFYAFEPWDVEKRKPEHVQLALEDGVDLYADEFVRHVGVDPHPFQSGYLFSDSYLRFIIAGSQIGKSYSDLVESLIMTSGEIPISLRFEKGYDTRIKRAITDLNVRRFGRRDARTGTFIDRDVNAHKDPSAWDCGTIIGAGVFPKDKILRNGDQVWIGTFMKAMQNYWWPRFYDKAKLIIPEFFIDRDRGNNGYSVEERTVYLLRGTKVVIITYESGYERFEAESAGKVTLDEEPPDQRIFNAAQQHAKHALSIVETPYRGITYTRDLAFPSSRDRNVAVFHATQYDSPYQDNTQVDVKRKNMEPWERGARIWGVHSEIQGAPYYDRVKITGWISKYRMVPDYIELIPSADYHGVNAISTPNGSIKGLMDISVNKRTAVKEDSKAVWRVYEDVKPDVGYVLTADPAEGDDDPSKAGDWCAAQIWRPNGTKKPVLCAALDSTLPTVQFARVCGLALRYWNNALLGAETKRGFSNATFAGELREWPYWYHMITVQQSTRKPRQQIGFDTNAKTRDSIFELIGKWLSDYDEDSYPDIPDKQLLVELAGAIKGRGGRCDHTTQGSLDRAVCFGIFLYILEYSKDQIACRVKAEQKRSGWMQIVQPQEPSVWLGSGLAKQGARYA